MLSANPKYIREQRMKNVVLQKEKVMGNDKNVYERLWKLWTVICKMIMDGVRNPEKVAEVLQSIVDGAGKDNSYLLLLYTDLVVGAVNAVRTFSNSGFIIRYVRPCYNRAIGHSTEKTFASVFELIKNGTFNEIFSSLGKNRPRWKTEGQIVEFLSNHRIMPDHSVFFELEEGSIVEVSSINDCREIKILSLEQTRVWNVKDRCHFAFPQS